MTNHGEKKSPSIMREIIIIHPFKTHTDHVNPMYVISQHDRYPLPDHVHPMYVISQHDRHPLPDHVHPMYVISQHDRWKERKLTLCDSSIHTANIAASMYFLGVWL